jgi:hypothetical protein
MGFTIKFSNKIDANMDITETVAPINSLGIATVNDKILIIRICER